MGRRRETIRVIRVAAATLAVGCGIGWIVAASQGVGLAHPHTPKADLQILFMALEAFNMDHGRYPTQEEGLAVLVTDDPSSSLAPYMESRHMTDLWGNSYTYVYPSRHGTDFDIWSPGEDGLDGTLDDIQSWNLEELERMYPSGCRRRWVAHPFPTIFGWGFCIAIAALLGMWIVHPLLIQSSEVPD